MGVGPFGAVRDIARLHEITSVLIRHGLGDLVQRAGIGTVLERTGQILNWRVATQVAQLEPQVRARMALEELGPTFVKLGQMLSTRGDLFDPSWITEFERLQSQVKPVPFEELLPHVERTLGRPPDEVFVDLDRTPLASASIAQVHRARLPSGAPVVLKIRRPGIQATVDADLRILQYVAGLLEANVQEARQYQVGRVVAEFSHSLQRELDLAVEARNIERCSRNFADDAMVLVPRVYGEWTSTVMNVQEYVQGIKGNDQEAIRAAGLDGKRLAKLGVDTVLKMILVDGFFHADPHPGNCFYLPGNRMVMVDFGMVGRLTNVRRAQIIELFAAVGRCDEQAITDVILDWTGTADVDEQRLARDIDELLFDFAGVPLKDVRIGNLLRDLNRILREHSIVLPADLTLMFKALITLEGLGRQFDPDLQITEHLGAFVENALTERYKPAALARRGRQGVAEFASLIGTMPRDIARLIKDLRRGKMQVDLDLKRLDSFGQRLDQTIDRITVGIMTASLVIGSSIVMTVQSGPEIFGIPLPTALGLVGYLIAFVNSLWIILSIWRANRR